MTAYTSAEVILNTARQATVKSELVSRSWRPNLPAVTQLIPAFLLVCLLVPSSLPASASVGTLDRCVEPTGMFVIEHQVLRSVHSDNKPLDYQIKNKHIINRSAGYCVSDNCGGRRFPHEHEQYLLDASFTHIGRTLELRFFCEFSSDSSPALCNCSKSVTTESASYVDKLSGYSARWNHNGSTAGLVVVGLKYEFRYITPRPGMKRACAKSGDVIFKGERSGNRIDGVAFLFSCSCGPISYPVHGNINEAEDHIKLTGMAPSRDAKCRSIGSRLDKLLFARTP